MNKKEKSLFWATEVQKRIPDLNTKRREQLLKQLSRIRPGKPRSEHAVTRDLIIRLKSLKEIVDRAPDAVTWDSADISELTIISRAEIEAFLFAEVYTGESGVSSTIEQLQKLGIPIHGKDGNREWDASLPTEYAVKCDPTAYSTDGWTSRALGEKTTRGKQLYTLRVDGCLSPKYQVKTKKTFTIPDTRDIFQVFSVAPPNKETVSTIRAFYKATKEEAKERANKKAMGRAEILKEKQALKGGGEQPTATSPSPAGPAQANAQVQINTKPVSAVSARSSSATGAHSSRATPSTSSNALSPKSSTATGTQSSITIPAETSAVTPAELDTLTPAQSSPATGGSLLDQYEKGQGAMASRTTIIQALGARSSRQQSTSNRPGTRATAGLTPAKRESIFPSPAATKKSRTDVPADGKQDIYGMMQEAKSLSKSRRSIPRPQTPHGTSLHTRHYIGQPARRGEDAKEIFLQQCQDDNKRLQQELVRSQDAEAQMAERLSQLERESRDAMGDLLETLKEERSDHNATQADLDESRKEYAELADRYHILEKKHRTLLEKVRQHAASASTLVTNWESTITAHRPRATAPNTVAQATENEVGADNYRSDYDDGDLDGLEIVEHHQPHSRWVNNG